MNVHGPDFTRNVPATPAPGAAPATPAAPAPPAEPEAIVRDTREAGVEFRYERWLRLPWMEPTPHIEPEKVAKILRKAKPDKLERLRVQPSDAKVMLPLRSAEDLQELAIFARHGSTAALPQAELGDGLQALADRGWRFEATRDGSRYEVGLYGAYNCLTDASHGLTRLQAKNPARQVELPLADAKAALDLVDFYRNPAPRGGHAATLVGLEEAGYRLVGDRPTFAYECWQKTADVWVGRDGQKWLPLDSLDLSTPDTAKPVLEQVGRLVQLTGDVDAGRAAWNALLAPVPGTDYDQREALMVRLGKAEGRNSEAGATYGMLKAGLAPRQSFEEVVTRYEGMRAALGKDATPSLARSAWASLKPLNLDDAGLQREAGAIGRHASNKVIGAANALSVWSALREEAPDPAGAREQLLGRLLAAEKGNDAQLSDALAGYALLRETRREGESLTEVGELLLKALKRSTYKSSSAAHAALRAVRKDVTPRPAPQVEAEIDLATRLFAALPSLERADALWTMVKGPAGTSTLEQRVEAFLALNVAEKGANSGLDAERDYLALRDELLPNEDFVRSSQALGALLKAAGEPEEERTREVLLLWEASHEGASSDADLRKRTDLLAAWLPKHGVMTTNAAVTALQRLRPDLDLTSKMEALNGLLAAESQSKVALADALSDLDRALAYGGGAERVQQFQAIMTRWGYRNTKEAQAAFAQASDRAAGDAEVFTALAEIAALSPDPARFPKMLAALDGLPTADARTGALLARRFLAQAQKEHYPENTLAADLKVSREVAGRMGGLAVAGEVVADLVAAMGRDNAHKGVRRLADLWTGDESRDRLLTALTAAGSPDPAAKIAELGEDQRTALRVLLEGRRFRYPGVQENLNDLSFVQKRCVPGETLTREAERLVEVHQALANSKARNKNADTREVHKWLRERLAEGALGEGVTIEKAHTALTRMLVSDRPLDEAKQALLEGAALKVVEEEESVTVGGITLPKQRSGG